ncbi:daunorubicin resistance ABC transporter ATPase subunit [Methanolacinia petrolearia DSM 11571]|uniref:Daunorubicin resistance ABC transporter ATPase subunit n=1 Tax=Methanolacinia petrolearia (strain DSM 11571 / OCM 486 / SEBR 4847) TaxID=679926 RepID=E1RH39_METP4|nr:daunorubicin resistance protein DrrA family ABC transporter ATP-binding protein [Methanolacinia petrolearia]ADN35263.1 daunorubicin resistance ABC transporter ATPase subunit [Methanolacinia petrolearia DSM 11571]
MKAVTVENLTKKFGDFTAVDNISFDIDENEIFGLLGPNGAGKSTTISILATMADATSGKAIVNGHDTADDEDGVRKSIGIVFQDQSLDEELTAWENMDFHGRLYRIPGETRDKRIKELLELVGLYERKDDLVKTFSGGMRRRLEIARGLLHRPKVLFLDEPTLGLDPQTRNYLWEYIENLNREFGISVIITTHYMEEADRLCDRIGIIDQGRIIALDTPENLKNSIGGDIITVKSPDFNEKISGLNQPWIENISCYDGFFTISLSNAEEHLTAVISALLDNGIEISSVSVHKPTLEDVFLHYTGKTIRDAELDSKDHMRMMHNMRRH